MAPSEPASFLNKEENNKREREKKEREEVSYHNSLSMCKEGMLLMKVGGRCSSLPERVYLR